MFLWFLNSCVLPWYSELFVASSIKCTPMLKSNQTNLDIYWKLETRTFYIPVAKIGLDSGMEIWFNRDGSKHSASTAEHSINKTIPCNLFYPCSKISCIIDTGEQEHNHS